MSETASESASGRLGIEADHGSVATQAQSCAEQCVVAEPLHESDLVVLDRLHVDVRGGPQVVVPAWTSLDVVRHREWTSRAARRGAAMAS